MQRKTSSTICSAWIQQALKTCLLYHASLKGTPTAQFSGRNRLHGDLTPWVVKCVFLHIGCFFLFKEKHFNTCKVVWCGYSPREATPESPEKCLKNADPGVLPFSPPPNRSSISEQGLEVRVEIRTSRHFCSVAQLGNPGQSSGRGASPGLGFSCCCLRLPGWPPGHLALRVPGLLGLRIGGGDECEHLCGC